MAAQDITLNIQLPQLDNVRQWTGAEGESVRVHISTGKSSSRGFIDVSASVEGVLDGIRSFSSSDFRKKLARVPCKRVMQKNIDLVHLEVVTGEAIEELTREIEAFYNVA